MNCPLCFNEVTDQGVKDTDNRYWHFDCAGKTLGKIATRTAKAKGYTVLDWKREEN